MKLSSQAKTALTEAALDSFWRTVGSRFPQARTGDLSWDAILTLQSAAEHAIEQWVANNVPD
jgi:hypothetical protein